MSYRYSKSQSQMNPPFWVIKDGVRHIAETWDERNADLIVSALKGAEDEREECAKTVEAVAKTLCGHNELADKMWADALQAAAFSIRARANL